MHWHTRKTSPEIKTQYRPIQAGFTLCFNRAAIFPGPSEDRFCSISIPFLYRRRPCRAIGYGSHPTWNSCRKAPPAREIVRGAIAAALQDLIAQILDDEQDKFSVEIAITDRLEDYRKAQEEMVLFIWNHGADPQYIPLRPIEPMQRARLRAGERPRSQMRVTKLIFYSAFVDGKREAPRSLLLEQLQQRRYVSRCCEKYRAKQRSYRCCCRDTLNRPDPHSGKFAENAGRRFFRPPARFVDRPTGEDCRYLQQHRIYQRADGARIEAGGAGCRQGRQNP